MKHAGCSHIIITNMKVLLMPSIVKLIAISTLAACIAVANAAEKDQAAIGGGGAGVQAGADNTAAASKQMIRFGGFGTLGLSHSSQRLGDYVLDGTVPKGPGRSSDWSAGNDSRIGVQMSADLTARTSVVLQVVSEYQADSTYRPTVEWANVKYAFSRNVYVRAGRIALPTFLNSDSRRVGYSYPWIHPPLELYRQLSITSSDGVDAMYRFEIAGTGNSIKAIYGQNKIDRPTGISSARGLWGIFDTLEYGSALFRVGYQERESSLHNKLTGVTGAWITNSDLSVGASYDPGNWFAVTEWIQRKSTTKISAMYISAGYRVNKFTPYLTYSQNSPASYLADFNATAPNILSAKRSQSTVSLGTRWDFIDDADFKLQYDQVRLSDTSNGYLANVPAGVYLYGTRFHVISAVLDFVF